jgi:hypothetical protein
MLPRAQFLEITRGMIDLAKGTVFCGHNTYVVMYPVEKGSLVNMVAVKRIPTPTNDRYESIRTNTNWIQPITAETVLSDFAN